MVIVRTNVREEEIRFDSQHTLFVEGKDEKAIDPTVLRSLLPSSVRVLALGPSFHVRSAAEALYPHHPNYYFLIDRDHYDDTFVERCWGNFPDPTTHNLLIWHRRELENYFIIPEYLSKSQYLHVSDDRLRDCILDCCRRRLFFDVANQVIVWVREELKLRWIELFKKVSDFRTKAEALARLTEAPELALKKKTVAKQLGKRELMRRFSEVLSQIADGRKHLEYGHGRWLELLRGKGVLPTVVNRCFRVEDAKGNVLQGREQLNEIVKDLLGRPLTDQPDDFQKLRDIITARLSIA